ncbi:conserved hypothetical protein [Methanocaldococcus jannaschii DSM 2661]|uniref:Uncharacterized protein MJ0452 n=1 Tax=Methanocaldococcus jannaschii (strain ATCC 43067 / DSM 2661 / JAL-1 / JCM 10045 / NBRC 100440) TaxID=243232 RepID=Y452_METJA|nr:DUF1890 family protein [Methanocaldococcus jannaschii]Q57894.1 RecName: Full=Uncharacterized protein MJ0452 [Methanocaldococcus jannaschii DSM 2661]AAB98441.1 conserved hypothetical protein [Methanocaldococcus jannaschii DSM 2661]
MMSVLVIVGCPEPPALIPSVLYLTNQLKKKGFNVIIAANPAALKLLEVADDDKYYLKGVGAVDIDGGLRGIEGINKIISFVHNDGGVSYTVTYKAKYNKPTYAIVFGRQINKDYVETLKNSNIGVYTARAFHNPMPIVNRIKEILANL